MRSIKWLERIEVAAGPSSSPVQVRDYKLFPASVKSAGDADWENGLTIDAMPINAALCSPRSGASLDAGKTVLRGYAIAYGRGVARVEISVDGGKRWIQAAIDPGPDTRWSWIRWTCEIELPNGSHEIVVRAVDTAGQGQPEHPEQVWNFAGYLSTSWHRSVVTVT